MVLGQYVKGEQLVDSEMVCQACGASDCRRAIARGVRCYIQCAHCDSYRLVPQPTSGELSTYYATMVQSGNYAVSAGYKHSNIRKFGGLLELIQSTRNEYGIAPFQTLLDIGCFDGTFLDIAQQQGMRTYGFDPMAEVVKQISSRHHVWSGTLEPFPFDNIKFDIVTMNDVIEHLPSPADYIQFAWHVLRQRGLLILTTPDASSWVGKLFGKRWGVLDGNEHLFVYSQKGLVTQLTRSRFRVLSLSRYYKTLSLSYFLDQAVKWQVGRNARGMRLPAFMADRTIRVHVGELFATAQKVET